MIALTYFPRLRDPNGQRVRCSWPALVARLTSAREVADKSAAPGISLATYAGDRRALANVEAVYAVGLDLDEGSDWETLASRFAGVASIAHTTWSSSPASTRARVFLLLSRRVTSDEYRRVYAGICGVCERGGLVVDRSASDPSRFWFLPSTPLGSSGSYRSSVGHGPPVNVDGWLGAIPSLPPAAATAPARRHTPHHETGANVEARARAYLARCEPAISGQGGHKTTFICAQRLVRSFGLDEDTAYGLLCEWNGRCQPPWSESDLRRKIRQATDRGRFQRGDMMDRPLSRPA